MPFSWVPQDTKEPQWRECSITYLTGNLSFIVNLALHVFVSCVVNYILKVFGVRDYILYFLYFYHNAKYNTFNLNNNLLWSPTDYDSVL